MAVRSDSVLARLTPDEIRVVRRAVQGQGGMQSLLRELIPRLQADGTLLLTGEEAQKVRRYAQNYGEGGFQERFRIILGATEPRSRTLESEW